MLFYISKDTCGVGFKISKQGLYFFRLENIENIEFSFPNEMSDMTLYRRFNKASFFGA